MFTSSAGLAEERQEGRRKKRNTCLFLSFIRRSIACILPWVNVFIGMSEDIIQLSVMHDRVSVSGRENLIPSLGECTGKELSY